MEFGVVTTFSRYVIYIIPVDIDILDFFQNIIYFCATFFIFDNTFNIEWKIAVCLRYIV